MVTSNPDAAATPTSTLRTTGTLTGTAAGPPAGAVTSDPAGITGGASCSASFNVGAIVALTVAPGSQARFKGWGGACSGTATTCTLTMTDNLSVTGTFSMVFTDATSDDLLPAGTR